jgi:hypothetical protein
MQWSKMRDAQFDRAAANRGGDKHSYELLQGVIFVVIHCPFFRSSQSFHLCWVFFPNA